MPSVSTLADSHSADAVFTSWFDGESPNEQNLLVRELAGEGYCYLRILYYFDQFGFLDISVFKELVERFKADLGKDPTGMAVLTLTSIYYWNVLEGRNFADEQHISEQPGHCVTAIHDVMKTSEVKVRGEEKDGKLHLSGGPITCDCDGPLCAHGWTYRFLSTISIRPGRILGASGFNINDYLDMCMEGEDDMTTESSFEEAYSSLETELTPRPVKPLSGGHGRLTPDCPPLRGQQMDAKARVLDALCQDEELMSPLRARVKVKENLVGKIKREEERSRRQVDELQDEIRFLRQRTMSLEEDGLSSILPGDSSTNIERYSSKKRFMAQGTVLNVSSNLTAGDRDVGETHLTVEDSLVSGFRKDEESSRQEAAHLSKLKPINGLPRPYTSKRLNFLANLHTGLERALRAGPRNLVSSLMEVMLKEPRTPVDNLLHQVLVSSIDRYELRYVANAFNLPYIELGMQVTVDSVHKWYDLIMCEYKSLWFQEMKSILVPKFSSDYLDISHEQVGRSRASQKHQTRESEASTMAPTRSRKSRSILGF